MHLLHSIILSAAIYALRPDSVDSKPFCPPCQKENNCDNTPEDCFFGVAIDYCGRNVCIKGPGQRCGGSLNVLGQCDKGLQCKCNKCTGCSVITLNCHYNDVICF